MFDNPYVLAGLVAAVIVTGAIVLFLASRRPKAAERRREPRIEAPPNCAVLSVEGAPYPLKNWSATGFLADPYEGNLAVGQKCIVNIHVRQDPFDIAFAAEVVIVRKGEGELAGRFVFLPPDNKMRIDAYFAYFGQMR